MTQIKEWAENKSKEYVETIQSYIKDGWTPKKAFDFVMSNSTLGTSYKAQIRHEIGLGIFD